VTTARSIGFAAWLLAALCSSAAASGTGPSGATPDEVTGFARALQAAVQERDVPGVMALTSFPLRVNFRDRKARRVGRSDLERNFDQVFTPSVVRAVTEQDPATLFENARGVMFGNGSVWASKVCEDRQCVRSRLLVVAVNP
jgi:hypothetical protein